VNSLFSGNTVVQGDGGAIYGPPPFVPGGGTFALTNCTLAQNTATAGGAIFHAQGSTSATIENCIIWLNSPNQIQAPSTLAVTYTNVQGVVWSGQGNISATPDFINPPGGDGLLGTEDDNLRLLLSSPSIGAGNPVVAGVIPLDVRDIDDDSDQGEFTPDLDITDRVVPLDPADVDMGCYACKEQEPCPWDVTNNGVVDIQDWLAVFQQWGTVPPHTADIAPDCGDGDVGSADFLLMVQHWGESCTDGFAGGEAPGAGAQDSAGVAPGSGLTLDEALFVLGFASEDEYMAWVAVSSAEDVLSSAALLATLMGG
jgi:hypothetical protein